ncbi:transmembrane and coiled-coil domain-containing protein 6-like [Trematomus bernacchii]|uniref:transmembrane and coiled-coil domain-containing protein 6-like n=1 Tax=Trematomus bernacchii TaxID=40690 RepID=UPI00146A013F|nr:transmembrane and coiled-coil domain-containing protein 6-like [Trematomus bernacchii]
MCVFMQELCLYTLGNLCPDSVVKEKLLAQGIVPALASCLENQRHNLAVVEAVGFTLSQLLQANDAAEKIIPMVLASSLPSHLLSVLTPDPKFGLGPAIECAWCIHYLTCSMKDHRVLLAQGALLQCSSLLVSLGGAVAEGNKEEGMELVRK